MGRTLHYAVIGKISDDQWDRIDALQDSYNDKNSWTCEHLSLTRIPYWYPRWPRWFADSKLGKTVSVADAWQMIQKELADLAGVKLEQKVMELVDRKLLALGDPFGKDIGARGFTKVADNEWNARLVVEFLIEASKMVPQVKINIYDEGDYILCKYIFVENGVITLDRQRIEEYLAGIRARFRDPKWGDYFKKCVRKMEENLILAELVTFLNAVDPDDYQDHPEFKTLNIELKGGHDGQDH